MLMAGQDVLCVLPTSVGKTACFVMPTLAMEWRTLVFSPLVALMRDQVQSLERKRIAAAQLSGMQSDAENMLVLRRWMAGEIQILYTAPERLKNEMFQQAIRTVRPDMVALDEAHCLSSWGDNFRPEYAKVGDFVRELQPKVVVALSATLPDDVEADVRRVLGLGNAKMACFFSKRLNLNLKSRNMDSAFEIADVAKEALKGPGSVIIYCSTIKKMGEFVGTIQPYLGHEIGIFHGELDDNTKRSQMDLFMQGHVRCIAATKAFGMGVDKGDVRAVIHRHIPGSLEDLAQEVGRAGRDGLPSECVTFFDKEGIDTQNFFLDSGHPSEETIHKLFRYLQASANRAGIIKRTVKEMAIGAKIRSVQADAAVQILSGAGVIERNKTEDKVCRVKFLKASEDPRVMIYTGMIESIGIKNDDYYEFDENLLSVRIGVERATVYKWLRTWHEKGMIIHEPPFRGYATKVVGRMELIDFERLKEKAEHAYRKFDQVMEYNDVPDDEKHDFLENYFLNGQKR